nr:hypothetical protein CFP56_09214 [Quercus suber]
MFADGFRDCKKARGNRRAMLGDRSSERSTNMVVSTSALDEYYGWLEYAGREIVSPPRSAHSLFDDSVKKLVPVQQDTTTDVLVRHSRVIRRELIILSTKLALGDTNRHTPSARSTPDYAIDADFGPIRASYRLATSTAGILTG